MKWISELTATTPVTDAARRVLAVRLGLVRDFLPLAMRQADEDPEHAHQLRVSTRRARAALDIFACCLPDKVYQRTRRKLRRVRRAAGAARDWDVFLIDLATQPGPSARQQPGRDFVVGHASAHRLQAQLQLEQASPNFPFDFERLLAQTVAAVHRPRFEPEPRTLAALARPMLRQFLDALHEAAAGDLNDYQRLHQARIAGKRLRYAMEVFVDCFDSPFRAQLYPQVEKMQEILGPANDSQVAGQRLAELRARLRLLPSAEARRYRPGIDALRRFHERRLKRQQQEFFAWWKGWQESGTETAFRALLQAVESESAGAPVSRLPSVRCESPTMEVESAGD